VNTHADLAAPALEIQRLSHRYGNRLALDRVTFSVGRGETFALLGPNGGGKTTLFRVVATLLRPSEGTVSVEGHDVRRHPADVRRTLGVVFQSPALDPQLTVDENLTHHGHLYGLHGRMLDARITDVVGSLSLADRRKDRVGTLSGGLQRRVDLAKALLHDPRVLVLDEPSTGLDPGARRELWAALSELRARRAATVLLTTHLMDEAARCDRVAILHHGVLVALGTPTDLTGTVGGDVLWLTARDPVSLIERLHAQFDVRAAAVDGRVRIERPRGHEFVPEVIEAFPGEIDSVTLSRPTLEDVFVHHTGVRFS
jgi:ABC-2 type transport system ATP-binding protein